MVMTTTKKEGDLTLSTPVKSHLDNTQQGVKEGGQRNFAKSARFKYILQVTALYRQNRVMYTIYTCAFARGPLAPNVVSADNIKFPGPTPYYYIIQTPAKIRYHFVRFCK